MPVTRYLCIFINVGLGEGAPAIGVPFFWPSAAMPNTVIDSWSSMVFLKFNGAKFSATDYPVLAKVFPSLVLPEARGDFIRIWDDGRGVDSGRGLLREGANKRGNSSRLTQSFHFFMFEPIFSPVNALNQPI